MIILMNSVKVFKFDMNAPKSNKNVTELNKKHLKKYEGYICRNILYVTIKMRTKV